MSGTLTVTVGAVATGTVIGTLTFRQAYAAKPASDVIFIPVSASGTQPGTLTCTMSLSGLQFAVGAASAKTQTTYTYQYFIPSA